MRTDEIIATLNQDEIQVLVKIEHTKKFEKTRIFSADKVRQKFPNGFDLDKALKSLQKHGIIQCVHPGKHLWEVVDKEVEHAVKIKEEINKTGLSRILRRP